MDGRVHGLVPGPAQGALFRPVGGRTFPARATPARWRQVLIKPPEDLPPFLCALAGSIWRTLTCPLPLRWARHGSGSGLGRQSTLVVAVLAIRRAFAESCLARGGG